MSHTCLTRGDNLRQICFLESRASEKLIGSYILHEVPSCSILTDGVHTFELGTFFIGKSLYKNEAQMVKIFRKSRDLIS